MPPGWGLTDTGRMTTFRLGPWNELAEGVFVLVAQPANVNIGLVVGERACLLVDTGSTPEQGRLIRARVAEVTDRPLTHVVVTHAHWDHLYGLAAFDDVETLGHESIAASLAQAPDATSRQCADLGISPDDLVAPNRPFGVMRAIDLGGRVAQIVHVGPAHTTGDAIVIVDRVVFTGDLVEQGADPSIEPAGTLASWPLALECVLKSAAKGSLFVPGHGDPVDERFVQRQRSDLLWIVGEVSDNVRNGITLASALASLGTDTAPDWPFNEATMRDVLPVAYGQLAREGHTPRRQLPITSV